MMSLTKTSDLQMSPLSMTMLVSFTYANGMSLGNDLGSGMDLSCIPSLLCHQIIYSITYYL